MLFFLYRVLIKYGDIYGELKTTRVVIRGLPSTASAEYGLYQDFIVGLDGISL